jgi:hypothetical protein
MAAPRSTTTPLPRVDGIVPERRLLGVVLLIIGSIIALVNLSDVIDRSALIAISLTTLGAFALSRQYGYAVAAGVTGGLGVAVLVITAASLASLTIAAVLFLSMTVGFAAVWLLGLVANPSRRHPWPLAAAAVLGAMGLAFAAGQPGAIAVIQLVVVGAVFAAGTRMIVGRQRGRA